MARNNIWSQSQWTDYQKHRGNLTGLRVSNGAQECQLDGNTNSFVNVPLEIGDRGPNTILWNFWYVLVSSYRPPMSFSLTLYFYYYKSRSVEQFWQPKSLMTKISLLWSTNALIKPRLPSSILAQLVFWTQIRILATMSTTVSLIRTSVPFQSLLTSLTLRFLINRIDLTRWL